MKKYFPYLILFTALLISCTGSFFSIYGLGKLFGGHQVGATIIAFSFEFGNIITAATLKYYWKFLPNLLKFPLIIVVFALTILTSLGIYGYLSDGYQKTAMKDEIVTKKSNLVKSKKEIYETRVDDNKKELESLNISIQDLTKSFNVNTQTEQIDRRTGQKITNVIVGSKKGLENQLNLLNNRKSKLDSVNNIFLDSIQRLELVMIELESSNETNSELGPLKYLSGLINKPMNQIVNWLILLIVIVFQPLALMLILTAMFAFKNNHYLTRKTKKEKMSILSDIKKSVSGLVEKTKNKFKKTQPVISPTPTNIEPEKKVRKPRQKKVQVSPEETQEITPIITEEIVEHVKQVQPKKPRSRKIVDTNLTADIAQHISQSLNDKKK